MATAGRLQGHPDVKAGVSKGAVTVAGQPGGGAPL